MNRYFDTSTRMFSNPNCRARILLYTERPSFDSEGRPLVVERVSDRNCVSSRASSWHASLAP
jgi:hypothetical protein